MSWKELTLFALMIVAATGTIYWQFTQVDQHIDQLDDAQREYQQGLAKSSNEFDRRMAELYASLDGAQKGLTDAEARYTAQSTDLQNRLGDIEERADSEIAEIKNDIDGFRASAEDTIQTARSANDELTAQLRNDINDEMLTYSSVVNDAILKIDDAVNASAASADQATSTVQNEIDRFANAVNQVSASAEMRVDQSIASEIEGLQEFVDHQKRALDQFKEQQQQAQVVFVETQNQERDQLIESQNAAQAEFIEEQTQVRESMREQTEEIAAAISEGRPVSWTAIEYISAAFPRREGEVVSVFGRGTLIETQFADAKITTHRSGESGVVGITAEPINGSILASLQLPDERFRMNRAVTVRWYEANSSQPIESSYAAGQGSIRFKDDGIDCNDTKVYSYGIQTNRITELGNGCGWFDFTTGSAATRVYILAENIQE